MAYTAITGTVKVFQIASELPTFPSSSGEQAYHLFRDLINQSFVADPHVGVIELITLVLQTP